MKSRVALLVLGTVITVQLLLIWLLYLSLETLRTRVTTLSLSIESGGSTRVSELFRNFDSLNKSLEELKAQYQLTDATVKDLRKRDASNRESPDFSGQILRAAGLVLTPRNKDQISAVWIETSDGKGKATLSSSSLALTSNDGGTQIILGTNGSPRMGISKGELSAGFLLVEGSAEASVSYLGNSSRIFASKNAVQIGTFYQMPDSTQNAGTLFLSRDNAEIGFFRTKENGDLLPNTPGFYLSGGLTVPALTLTTFPDAKKTSTTLTSTGLFGPNGGNLGQKEAFQAAVDFETRTQSAQDRINAYMRVIAIDPSSEYGKAASARIAQIEALFRTLMTPR